MKKKVLFLCTGNSCRSQIGEGLLRHLAGDQFDVYSAGVNPTKVNPRSVEIMKEKGIDISAQVSTDVRDYLEVPFDYVITVCNHAEQTCPRLSGNHQKIHWDLEDPAKAEGTEQEVMSFFRKTRDEIEKRIREFLRDHH